jgi:hypothetical protein
VPRPTDRRRQQRYAIDTIESRRIGVRVSSQSGESCGYLQNISEKGMCLQIDRLPPSGAQVRIAIESPEGPKLEVVGRVIWTTEFTDPGSTGADRFGVIVEGNSGFQEFFEILIESLDDSQSSSR